MSIINKVLELLHEQGKSQADICKYLGIKQNVFTTWKTRGTDPPAKFVVQICEFFDVSLEYMVLKKTIENVVYQFITAIGEYININNIKQYVLGNIALCNFVVILLYGMSCFSCFFEIFTASILEIPYCFVKQNYPLIPLSNSIFLWSGAFSLFIFLYSRQRGSFKHQISSLCLLIITFILSAIFSIQPLQMEQAILVSTFTMIIPIYLLYIYSNIGNKNKENPNTGE